MKNALSLRQLLIFVLNPLRSNSTRCVALSLLLALVLQISNFGVQRCLLGEDLNNVAVARMKQDLSFFASDDQEGRDAGSEGIKRAAAYIVKRFEELGLKTDSFDGTPFQEFSLPGDDQMGEGNDLQFAGTQNPIETRLGENYTAVSLGSSGSFGGEVVFAGYGITAPEFSYDDYSQVDVTGKVVIVLRKEPQQQNADSVFDGTRSSQYAFFSAKELNAALHKVGALIMVNDAATAAENNDALPGVNEAGQAISDAKVPTYFCTRALIDPIVKQATGKSLAELEADIDSDLKPRSQILAGVTASGKTLIEKTEKPVRNVVGVLPGVGNLAEEYVVVGAHYDHVGMGGRGSLAPGTVAIHNGADDNGSGTTTMLEVARRLSEESPENRRTVIFMAFTAEERGLLGSKHYVRNPRWPIEDTVAMINMDMVGRLSDNRLTIYGTGTATEFDGLVERMNQLDTTKFSLDKQAAGYGPSDHSSFYEVGIPVFHFFTGLHNDYHRPSDDVEKVNFEGMARIATMVTEVVREIATAPDRPNALKTDAVARIGQRPSRRPRAVMGITLDTSVTTAKIAEVPEGSAAADAGLTAGDVIIKIDTIEIESVGDLRRAMGQKNPGDKALIVVQRGDETVEVELVLSEG